MKKKLTSNVVDFPNKYRLLENKARQAIEDEAYHVAVACYKELLEHEPDNEMYLYGIVNAFCETEEDAEMIVTFNRFVERMPSIDPDIVCYYLLSLLRFYHYSEVDITVKRMLFINKWSRDERENIMNIQALAERLEMGHRDLESAIQNGDNFDSYQSLILLDEETAKKQVFLFKDFLLGDYSPILKTRLLEKLIDDKVDIVFTVKKYDQEQTINPATCPKIEETAFFQDISAILEKELSDENPSVYLQALELVKKHNQLLFPMETDHHEIWAEAYQVYVLKALGVTRSEGTSFEVASKLSVINQLELLEF